MSTPLKALLQERLRAKIVRQGDDEDVAADGATLAMTTAPRIDPSEYFVPSLSKPSRARNVGSTSAGRSHNHSRSRSRPPSEPLAFDDDFEQFHRERAYAYRDEADNVFQRHYDTASHGLDAPEAFCLVSPVRAFSGTKRQWRAPRAASSLSHEEEPVYRHKRPYRERRVVGRGAESLLRPPSPPSPPPPTMPRKNYDLSGAYQRYRELSSKRGGSSDPPVVPPMDESREYDDTSSSWSAELPHRARPSRYDSNSPVSAPFKLTERRAARWRSPARAAIRTPPLVDTRRDHAFSEYDAESDVTTAPQRYERRDVYPVHHVTPANQHAVVSPGAVAAKSRAISPLFSSHFYEPYSDRHHESENKIVFRTAARVAPARRSPRHHQFLRHETAVDGSIAPTQRSDGDDRLSPESHQAAKDFVEKRQKRTSQGTPRTMATHRWLQSMVGARRDRQETHTDSQLAVSDSSCALLSQRPASAAGASECSMEADDHGRDAQEHDLRASPLVKPTPSRYAYHDSSREQGDQVKSYDAPLSSVFSPPRYTTAAPFFSSAV